MRIPVVTARVAAILGLLLTLGCGRQQASSSRTMPVFETQVKNAVLAGDGDQEILALRRRLMIAPDDLAARRQLAAKFDKVGYPDLALEHLRIGREHAPNDVELALDLVAKLTEQKLPEQASQVMSELKDIPAPFAGRAAILEDRLDHLTQGEALHRKSLNAAPDNVHRMNNLAYNLMQQRKAEDAENILREALRIKPSYELARNNLAMLYATQLAKPDEALSHWKAISGPAAAHNNLAAAYIESGKWVEAKAELEKALALRFQFPEAIQNLKIVAARTSGTVELKLDRDNRDKRDSGLSRLAKAVKHVFVVEEEVGMSKNRRSHQ